MSTPRRKRVSVPASPPPAKPRGSGPWIVAFVVIAAFAGGGFWLWRGRGASRPAEPSPDPLASTSPIEAFQKGIALASRGEALASLPYLRRAVAGAPNLGKAHANLGAALTNAALEVHTRQGRLDPAMRSSVERIGYVLEGDRETEAAIALATTRHEAASLLVDQASTYVTWGLVADALAMLRRAHELDPAWETPLQGIAALEHDIASGGAAK